MPHMDVYQLTDSQLDYLRMDLFYNPENAGLVVDYETFMEVPDELLFSYYDGVLFVEEDFSR